ncbi:MAG: hypothetical protein HY010_16790 [Acidobacteria bacterium]|nr:hypothetical protein [Acidobacteriota bacterium]
MLITTKTQQFTNASIFEVEVGATGLRGGDTGCGGRTYLRFKDLAGTDMRIDVLPAGDEISMVFGGDAEFENLLAGLEFAVKVLKESRVEGTPDDLAVIGTRDVP